MFSFPDTFDNTMLSTFCVCHRRFYWFMRRAFRSSEPPYFAFGKAFGAGINAWHAGQGKASEDARLAKALLTAQKEWYKDDPMPDNTNSLDNLLRLLEDYTVHYGEEERWKPSYKTGELGFAFPIPGTSYFYGGSLDQPIEWEGYGKMLREDKTTGAWITPSYMEQWELSTQVTGYMWAFLQLHGEVPFGALMNVASKKSRKEKDLQFGRRIVEHSEWKLNEFIEGTKEIIREIEWCHQWSSFPMTGARDPIACVGGMGRSACIYKDLCFLERNPEDIEDEELISSGYIIKPPWKPWEREGENE